MNKIIGFELKKLVSKPGIYILAVLLALLLTISAFIYNPKEKEVKYNKLDGSTVLQVSTDFTSNYKPSLDSNVNTVLNLATEISNNSYIDLKNEIQTMLNHFVDTCTTFSDIANSAGAIDTTNNDNLQEIHNNQSTGSLDVLYSTIKSYLGNTENKYFKIAIEKDDFVDLDTKVSNLKSKVTNTVNSKEYQSFARELTDYVSTIKNLVNSIHYPNYTNVISKFIENGNYYSITIERREVVLSKMKELTDQATADKDFNTTKSNVNKFTDLFNEYRILGEIYETLFSTSTNLVLMENIGINNLNKVKFLQNTNYYAQKELNTKYTYYIENDSNENNYATPLTFDFTSNQKVNGYDYTYFILSIFSVVLIVFAVMFAAYSIAGETKDGTMRFVAIRPISRTSIILGKFFAIAIMSLILLLFGSLVSFIVGGAVFGVESNNILTIINSTTVSVMHPAVSLLIYVGSLYLQLLVYISIAMMLTSFLKSDLLAFIITILFYILNMMLPLFFGTSSWLKFNPLVSINLYAFAGGGTIVSDTILGKLFTPLVYTGGSIILSVIYIVCMITIFNAISIYAFKKREL